MATVEEKVNCVLWLAELKSVTSVRRKFATHYRKVAPHKNTINSWMKKFKETGSVNDKPRSGRPPVSEETVAVVQKAFNRSPRKSLRRASGELSIPRSTLHKILKVKLRKVQGELNCSPRKSLQCESDELNVSQPTVHDILKVKLDDGGCVEA